MKSLAFIMPKVPVLPWRTSNITTLPEEVMLQMETACIYNIDV